MPKYENEPILNGVYSWNNSPKTKDRAYVINQNLCMWMVMMGVHLMIQPTFTALELNKLQKK